MLSTTLKGMEVLETLGFYSSKIATCVLKHLLWRPLGTIIFGHKLAFEELPFRQALSMLGSTLTFTHSKLFYPLTYVYDWKQFSTKQDPIIRLGVFGGTAQSANMFMMSQKKHPHAELVAVGSRTLERGKGCAREYDIPEVYSPYEQLLADPSIDGVVVFSPISTHKEWILKILEAGKHAILIPPIAANSTQLKRVLCYQREHHPKLLCVSAYAALAHPINYKMRDLIRSGVIGRVLQVVIRANWPPHAFHSGSIQFNYTCAGGAWEDLGPHAITLARLMLDDTRHFNHTASWQVQSAIATLPTFASDVDETMNATLLYGDVHVEIEVSLVKPMDTSIEIKGTQGTLRQTQWYRPEMFNKLIHVKADGTTTVTEYHGRGVEYGKGPWEYLLDYLVDGFQTLEPPPLGSGEEELRTMEIVDEVYQKSGLGIRNPTD